MVYFMPIVTSDRLDHSIMSSTPSYMLHAFLIFLWVIIFFTFTRYSCICVHDGDGGERWMCGWFLPMQCTKALCSTFVCI